MDVLIIVITFVIMLAGVAGVVLPVLPDVWLIWLAALGYGFLQEPLFNSWIGGAAFEENGWRDRSHGRQAMVMAKLGRQRGDTDLPQGEDQRVGLAGGEPGQ